MCKLYDLTHNMTDEYIELHQHERTCNCPRCNGEPDEQTNTRVGDELYVWRMYRGVGGDLPAKVLELYGNLALVEIARPDGSSELIETLRETPYIPIRDMRYSALPAYWQRAMHTHRTAWIGRPRPSHWYREPWR